MRTIVDLTEAQVESLAQLSDKYQTSRAALVRAAVDDYVERHTSDAWEEAFGLWKGKAIDGLAYQQNLRAEWE